MSPEPQPGDIGLVRIDGPTGLAIRVGQWLNGSGFVNVEHVFVYVGDGRIVEAEPGGARLWELSEYDGRPIVWVRCPPEHGQAVADAARSLVGTPYSAADYFALAAHRLHLPVPGLREYIADTGHMICSQLAAHAAHLGGWDLFPDRWDGYDVPADFYPLAMTQEAVPA